jgi:hypothetical protein
VVHIDAHGWRPLRRHRAQTSDRTLVF